MPAEQIDFEAEGLLDGLDGAARAERLALLEYLAGDGVPAAELRRATASGTLMFLPAERVIGGRARYTTAEVARLSGVAEDFLMSVSRAMGLPIPAEDEAIYTDSDLEVVKMTNVARAVGISDEELLDMLRALGRGLSQAAETMRALPLRIVLEPGMSEPALAQRYASTVSELAPLVAPLVSGLLNLHLRQMAQSEAINAAERGGGRLPGSREIAVCFADLVGFTRLGEEVPAEELGQLAVRLEALTTAVVEPPVRLVKTIGDAVMLASIEPRPLLDTGLSLLDAADAEGADFPQLRAGVAVGPALSRAGDWFGRPVNLASRITSIARPGSLLAEREVRESARDGYRWSFAGERRLRGIRDPVPLFRGRRLVD
jgi:adenylate cyclase